MADHDHKLTASDEALLEGFFDAARPDGVAEVEPSPELLARVLNDGYGVQDGLAAAAAPPAPAHAPPRPVPRRGPLVALWAAIGGAPGLAGLAAAAVAGLWIGLRPPEAVSSITASLFGATATETTDDDALLGYDMAYADLLTNG